LVEALKTWFRHIAAFLVYNYYDCLVFLVNFEFEIQRMLTLLNVGVTFIPHMFIESVICMIESWIFLFDNEYLQTKVMALIRDERNHKLLSRRAIYIRLL